MIVIGPGSVVSAIWDKAEAEDATRYDHTDYGASLKRFTTYMVREGRKGLPPQVIGRTVYEALTARKPKVRYAVVPERFKNWTMPRLLPKRVLDRLMAKQIGLLSS